MLAAVALVLSSTAASKAGTLSGTLVNFDFGTFGSVEVDLFNDLTPQTVTNFLSYVNSHRYDDTMIHRSVPNFVIQGGGFDAATANAITTDAMIPLEYSRANTKGTIAMARTSDPNSATSQWFFNTVDNSSTLGPQPGNPTANPPVAPTPGYAAFGWIVGGGMSTVNAIAAIPTFPLTDPFGEVPLTNYTQTDFNNKVNALPHVIVLNSVSVVTTHPAFQNPIMAADVTNDGLLHADDLLAVINNLLDNNNTSHSVVGPFSGTDYLDANGDGNVNAQDVLAVIDALLAAQSNSQSLVMPSLALMATSMTIAAVPEPPSDILAATCLLSLVGYLLRRRIPRLAKSR